MALLYALADKFADKYASRIETTVRGMTNAIPRTGVEGDMRRAHDQWLQTMQLGRPYWTEDAFYFWTTDDNGSNLRLAIMGELTFVRRDHLGAYTASGSYSWDYWWRSGPKGLTHPEPVRPPKPSFLSVKADLVDAAHPERWEVTYK
jgi:hypothetical protein